MKKIIITIIAILAIGSTASAFNYDQKLIDIWNKRPDLQKAFPNATENIDKLIEWAEKYGWQENSNLYEYYPEKEIVQRIVDDRMAGKIKELEARIKALEGRQPAVNTIERVVEKTETVVTEPAGEWRICCGFKTGNFNCGDSVQEKGCDISKYPDGSYKFYLYFKDYEQK
jgi:polyhydroxyalkanoate synthesis regulator phasin